nr:phenylalanine ammonia-lyase [Quercus suber]
MRLCDYFDEYMKGLRIRLRAPTIRVALAKITMHPDPRHGSVLCESYMALASGDKLDLVETTMKPAPRSGHALFTVCIRMLSDMWFCTSNWRPKACLGYYQSCSQPSQAGVILLIIGRSRILVLDLDEGTAYRVPPLPVGCHTCSHEMSLGAINDVYLSHWGAIAAKLKGHSASQDMAHPHICLTAASRLSWRVPQWSKRALTKEMSYMVRPVYFDILGFQAYITSGVNTGFGGSANTRTNQVKELQSNLLRMLQYGVITEERKVMAPESPHDTDLSNIISQTALPLDDPLASTSMPESWVRAAMLIRLNSLASGFSGIKETTLRTLHQILEEGITPLVPLKGSISASGDLSPLSYIAGVVQGKPGLKVWVRNTNGERCLKRADVALAEKGIKPVSLGAKEGLALVNGTAVSCAVGSLALHDAMGQANLSQILTAMTVEALLGTDESFDPFFGEVRSHPGQIETARNIHGFLSKSSLVQHSDTAEGELRQDRYSVRTASQWIGPVLEDLHLAHQQISIEMNSVTDNPLIDPAQDGKMMHGGNFQARAVTSAMEKTRQSLQTIGRMLFSQCAELINPATNRGLPPNLVAEEPSQSFIWKGTDIMIAALQAELGFLANPVGSHVQTAEMGNQSVNSLALISGRYTLEAVETLSQLSAAHLVACCQALDLRVMTCKYVETMAPIFKKMTSEAFSQYLLAPENAEVFLSLIWAAFQKALDTYTHFDSPRRFAITFESLQPIVIKHIRTTTEAMQALKLWTEQCCDAGLDTFQMNREAYYANPEATSYIGSASSRMYKFVRHELGVPFMSNKVISTPKNEEGQFTWGEPDQDSKSGVTMGEMVAKVYESMRTGQLYRQVALCVSEVHEQSSAAAQARTAVKQENTHFSYAMTKARELASRRGESPDSLSEDEKSDSTQSHNIGLSATVVDDTSYLLENEAESDWKVKETVDMTPNMAWKVNAMGFGDEHSQIHSIV